MTDAAATYPSVLDDLIPSARCRALTILNAIINRLRLADQAHEGSDTKPRMIKDPAWIHGGQPSVPVPRARKAGRFTTVMRR